MGSGFHLICDGNKKKSASHKLVVSVVFGIENRINVLNVITMVKHH